MSSKRFWYILLFSLLVGTSIAEFVPSSYLTLPQCIAATEVNAIYPNDPGWRDARVGERIRFVNLNNIRHSVYELQISNLI